MKFNSRIAMESRPDFHLDGVLAPLGFDASLHGGCHATLDSVSLTVGEVPIRLAIPFLKRRRPPVFVSIGRFKATLGPLRLTTEGMHFELKGVVGTDGIRGEAKGGVDCETKMVVAGDVRSPAGRLTVEFDEAEDPFEFAEHGPREYEEHRHEHAEHEHEEHEHAEHEHEEHEHAEHEHAEHEHAEHEHEEHEAAERPARKPTRPHLKRK